MQGGYQLVDFSEIKDGKLEGVYKKLNSSSKIVIIGGIYNHNVAAIIDKNGDTLTATAGAKVYTIYSDDSITESEVPSSGGLSLYKHNIEIVDNYTGITDIKLVLYNTNPKSYEAHATYNDDGEPIEFVDMTALENAVGDGVIVSGSADASGYGGYHPVTFMGKNGRLDGFNVIYNSVDDYVELEYSSRGYGNYIEHIYDTVTQIL